jgi:hypothetical protein
LEEQSNRSSHRRDVTTKTADEGKETSEKSNGAEEERNQVESEHESAQVVVLVCTNELLGDASLSAKIARWIEWKCWNRRATVGVQSILRSADGEEGPSRRIARIGDSIVNTSSQNGEELEEHTTSHKDEGQDSEDWS